MLFARFKHVLGAFWQGNQIAVRGRLQLRHTSGAGLLCSSEMRPKTQNNSPLRQCPKEVRFALVSPRYFTQIYYHPLKDARRKSTCPL